MDLRALGRREEQEGSPGLREEGGGRGPGFPWEIQRERQELRTSQVVGSCPVHLRVTSPTVMSLRELGQHCLGAASSMKEYSRRRDGNSFRPGADQGHSRLLAQGP